MGFPPASSPILRADIILSSAQLLAIFTTPITVVPAPGVGQALLPVQVSMNYIAGDTPYTDHAGNINFAVGSLGFLQRATAGFWDQAASQIMTISAGNLGSLPVTSWANQPITVGHTVANPTGGNGTCAITVLYYVIPAS